MFCKLCGHELSDDANFCSKCCNATGVSRGVKVNKVSRSTAFLLALFLGGFGAHKFYLRKTVQAVFMLLFFWTGIPALIAFVEAVVYLCTSDESFDSQYNKD